MQLFVCLVHDEKKNVFRRRNIWHMYLKNDIWTIHYGQEKLWWAPYVLVSNIECCISIYIDPKLIFWFIQIQSLYQTFFIGFGISTKGFRTIYKILITKHYFGNPYYPIHIVTRIQFNGIVVCTSKNIDEFHYCCDIPSLSRELCM